jgi:hypothetical protein
MKPLFFGIAALLVGLPAQSETIYLVLRHSMAGYLMNSSYGGTSMIYVPMDSIEQCNIAGANIKSSKRFDQNKGKNMIGFECIEGK